MRLTQDIISPYEQDTMRLTKISLAPMNKTL